ncbi:MAG: hypothetical protein OCC46_02220 [Pseudodesulfovibrio sp.]
MHVPDALDDDQDNPEISVTIEDGIEDMFFLTFKDNGGGICSSIIPEKCESIGMMLISDLPKRMGGSYSIDNSDGTTYSFVLEKDSEAE